MVLEWYLLPVGSGCSRGPHCVPASACDFKGPADHWPPRMAAQQASGSCRWLLTMTSWIRPCLFGNGTHQARSQGLFQDHP